MGVKPKLRIGKSVSTKFRTFHKASSQRINELKMKTMKKCSETKMWWAVRAYQQWRINKITDEQTFDINVFDADLDELSKVTR